MSDREVIDKLLRQYKELLDSIIPGQATVEEQDKALALLEKVSFYNSAFLIFPQGGCKKWLSKSHSLDF